MSNNRVGIECRNCHSVMKHSNHTVWLALGFALASVICIAQYKFDFASIIFLAGWVLSVGIAVLIMGRAKLELVYENMHFTKNT
ncbi:MAG: hypothetical protein GY829_03560 [Gammaproteobacteria bacterium]|nr:hypothetical protein [Gammaproteobacteria bacterium]